MNTMKRVLAFVLALAAVMGLCACGGPSTVIPEGAQNNKGNQSGSIDMSNVELGTVTYPLQTEDSLSIWCPTHVAPVYSIYESYKQSPWHTNLVKKTGVEVEWKHPVAGADFVQAYQLLMTEDVLPDIISYGISAGDAQMMLDENTIIDLREYLPKYAPDYLAYITAPGREEYLRSVTTEDGQIFMVRLFTESEYNSVAYGPVVRKDWLDECGLEVPKTIADWEVMLRTFRDKYGAKFTFPISRFTGAGLASGFGAFGSLNTNYYVDDGQIKLAQVQPEFKEYLGTLARWVDEGLMDEDSLTMKDEGFRTKALNNECGAAFVVMSVFTKMISDAKAEKSAAEWIAVPYPVEEEGKPTSWISYTSNIYDNGCVITTSCSEEKIATALQWLNYAYTEEGMLFYNFGEEGDTFTKDENGVVHFTDKINKDRDGVAAGCSKYTGMGNVGCCGVQLERFVYAKNDPVVAEGVYTWIGETEAAEHVMPKLILTADETARHADLFMAFSTYCNEMMYKIVAGEVSISEFDNMVNQMNKLGLQEALQIQNEAYQRFINQN